MDTNHRRKEIVFARLRFFGESGSKEFERGGYRLVEEVYIQKARGRVEPHLQVKGAELQEGRKV